MAGYNNRVIRLRSPNAAVQCPNVAGTVFFLANFLYEENIFDVLKDCLTANARAARIFFEPRTRPCKSVPVPDLARTSPVEVF